MMISFFKRFHLLTIYTNNCSHVVIGMIRRLRQNKTDEAAPEDGLAPVYKVGPVEIPNLGFLPGLPCMLGGSLLARDWM